MLDTLSAFDYQLPESLIAQTPPFDRGNSRLMLLNCREKKIEHQFFKNLPQLSQSEKLHFVFNNSKVMPARLLGFRLLTQNGIEKHGGKIEFLLLEAVNEQKTHWEGLFQSTAKQSAGLEFVIYADNQRKNIEWGSENPVLRGKIIRGAQESPQGTVLVELNINPLEANAGELPLPPYIQRDNEGPTAFDESRYQTVFAKTLGSAAAPTAGLHFTEELLAGLEKAGHTRSEITLHVGLGTFRPVKVENLSEHVMHSEYYEISSQAASEIINAKREGKKIVAVGTTSVRTLESSQLMGEHSRLMGKTNLFIRPKENSKELPKELDAKQFKVVDQLITNFHLPKSTLLMLVSTFVQEKKGSHEWIMKAYQEAIYEKYRFFSYGDAMWIR